MICKLCHAEAELKNSHIISEFQYKPLYDEKHRFCVVSIDPKQKEYFEQKGFREELLCGSCETKLSRWESYAKKVIFGEEAFFENRIGRHVLLGGISYLEFKLYLLSLLWRMSVSKLKHFSEVSLGPYEEKIRLHLLNEDPGCATDYPCLITAVLFQGSFETGWIIPPTLVKVNGVHCYQVVISGILFTFWVTKKPLAIDAKLVAINEKGNFLLAVEHIENIEFLRELVSRHSKAMKERAAKEVAEIAQ